MAPLSSKSLEGFPHISGYTLTEQLYEGARTAVYRAVSAMQQSVVIKIMRQLHPEFNELVHFRNQYAITQNLSIPGVVRPLSLEPWRNGYALVMEDFEGCSLQQYATDEQPRSLVDILGIALQMADILHGLNQHHVVHKDIKPANILIHPGSKRIQLIDFSIATLLPREAQEMRNPNVLEGTLAYLSPEQTGRMNRGIDYRTDFYGLGVTLYKLLTGQVPFSATAPLELVHCHIAKTPVPAHEVNIEISPMVSKIVSKLMAKNAEDRYQSALGLKHDLARCLEMFKNTGEVAEFDLGQRDVCDRFLIPDKLYGRDSEIQQLLAAFDRVSQGQAEMMLVAGFSGIGKTAVVNEVHKPITRQHGYFIKGKFDQFDRNIPFSAFVQAFRGLMGQLLGESDAELAVWKQKILTAVGVNGQAVLDVIPELAQVIGEQPALSQLSGAAAQNRFNLVFSKFVQVFTTQGHPLVIFLDDLQWADLASLNLLKRLMNDAESEAGAGYLLILGAYRDNEVSLAHPLMLTLEDIRAQGTQGHTVTLRPLGMPDVAQLVADTLRCSVDVGAPLSQLVYQKTQGNPFFTAQFLQGLQADGWIAFDIENGHWQCDLTQVKTLALTDDVVAFVVGRLRLLPSATQNILTLAACIGNRFDLDTLAVVCEQSPVQVAEQLWQAMKEAFIVPESDNYKFFQGDRTDTATNTTNTPIYRFAHDRIQQAAYLLLADESRIATHTVIGQLLLSSTPEALLDERICEIVSHLNIGTELLQTEDEIRALIQLNLRAANKTLSAAGYTTALSCIETGIALLHKLGNDIWQIDHDLALRLYEKAAESAYLSADFDLMESCIQTVLQQAQSALETVNVYKTKIQAQTAGGQPLMAVKTALQILQTLGVEISLDPAPSDIEHILGKTQRALAGQNITELLDLPKNTTPVPLAVMEILGAVHSAAFVSAPQLIPIEICTRMGICLEYGNAPESAHTYADYGLLLCAVLNDINAGYEFGELALAVTEQFPQSGLQARAKVVHYMTVAHWKESLGSFLPSLKQAYQGALDSGDLEFAAWGAFELCSAPFLAGHNLNELRPSIDVYCQAIDNIHQASHLGWSKIYGQTVVKLTDGKAGHNECPWMLADQTFDEAAVSDRYQADSEGIGLFILYSNKMMLAYLFGELALASEYADIAQKHVASVTAMLVQPAFFFYDSLVQLDKCASLSGTDASLEAHTDDRVQLLQRVAANQEKLKAWGVHCVANYQHKYELVEARLADYSHQYAEAIALYDKAISGAKTHEYTQERALANELAAKFYLDWSKEKIAAVYMQEAYYCYSLWGSKAKADDLEQRYPGLLASVLQSAAQTSQGLSPLDTTATIIAPHFSTHASAQAHPAAPTGVNAAIDVATILKTSQTLSSTIELEDLLRQLTHIILQDSGGDYCALMMAEEETNWVLRAITTLDHTELLSEPVPGHPNLPLKLIQYVKNTQETVVINKLETDLPVIDDFLEKSMPQSLLCLPLLNQGKLLGILYLRNRNACRAFTQERIRILGFLCTQAAISLENARLYQQSQAYAGQLEQSQLQTVQAEKMASLGNLVAGVAHEINNPIGFLNGSLNNAQTYLQDLFEYLRLYQQHHPQAAEPVQEKAEDIELEFLLEDFPKLLDSMTAANQRIKSISTSLRTFSRADTEHKVSADLHEGLDSTLLILKYRLKANEYRPAIEVVKDYGELPIIDCFPGQLNQVFMNLLANAIDIFDEAAEKSSFAELKEQPQIITVKTVLCSDPKWVEVRIRDNGKGMTADVKARIFDHLFTTKDVGKGTGLGLAIAQQIIVEKHGGSLTVQSELGQGTEFCIQLPL